MSIDWFTFTAQIINFLVLVWLLKRFLYRPIIDAMDAREKKIAAALDEATAARREAEAASAQHRQKIDELAHAKDDLLADAAREVEQWRQERLGEARDEVDDAKSQWYHALTRDRHSFIREARLRIAMHVHRLSSHVLSALADTDLQSRALEVFRDRMAHVDEEKRKAIAEAIRNSDQKVCIQSGFPIPAADRAQIVELLRQRIGAEVSAEFREDPELIFGVEVRAGGHKFAWSAREQLEQLEEEFVHSLDEALTSETATEQMEKAAAE